MANRYFLNIGANWGDTANWSDTSGGTGGFSVPTNADDVFFDANSGNCTVNASARTAKTLNFTGYTNTITMTFGITVSGNVTLAAGMGVAGTAALTVNTTATLTSNGKTWSADFTFAGISQTYTLADNWTISGVLRLSGGALQTINGNKIFTSGNLTHTATNVQGTTVFEITGGIWSTTGGGRIDNSITFNGNSTVSGTVGFGTGTLTYTSGVVTTTGSTLSITVECTLNTNGISWNNLSLAGGATYTLTSDLTINGLFSTSVGSKTIAGSYNINVSGGLSLNTQIQQGAGSTTLNLLGGTWSTTSVNGILRINTVINGNITISGNVYYNTGTLTYTSGTVTTTGSTLNIGASTTLNTSGMTWNNVTFSTSASVYTLLSDINISGTLNNQQNNTFNGLFNINTTGTVTATGSFLGTATLNVLGGTFNVVGVSCNLTFNGNVNIISDFNFGVRTLKYISGNITLSPNHLLVVNGTIDTNVMVWNRVTINTSPITFLSDFNVGGLLNHSNNISYNGAFNLNLYGGLSLTSGHMLVGSMTINLYGGTWTVTNPGVFPSTIRLPIVIRGNVTILGIVYFGSTLTFVNGQVNAKNAILNLLHNSTFINCDKINFKKIIITAATTQTFNRFFSGSALVPTIIQSTGTNYTIAFQDGFEKITKFTKISNCTISRPGQLLCITDKSNKGGNVGVRYINQMPNRVPLNNPSTANPLGYATSTYLLADPNTILN